MSVICQLQAANFVLTQKNKALDELCSDYSGKYKALISKTSMLEMENATLKQELESRNHTVAQYEKLCAELKELQHSMQELQSHHQQVNAERHRLIESSRSIQNKVNTQAAYIQRLIHQQSECELKLDETSMELSKLRSVLNAQNIDMEHLRDELQVESQRNHKRKHKKCTIDASLIGVPMHLYLSRSETLCADETLEQLAAVASDDPDAANGWPSISVCGISPPLSPKYAAKYNSLRIGAMPSTAVISCRHRSDAF